MEGRLCRNYVARPLFPCGCVLVVISLDHHDQHWRAVAGDRSLRNGARGFGDRSPSKLDIYSTQGNYNPYNGKSGTVDPYKPTQTNLYGSPCNKPRTQQRRSGYGY